MGSFYEFIRLTVGSFYEFIEELRDNNLQNVIVMMHFAREIKLQANSSHILAHCEFLETPLDRQIAQIYWQFLERL